MVIEINKDIDRYKESVFMGLTTRQLIYSVASLMAGAGIVLLLYRYIGLTLSVYVAVPVAAPIALGGFYSYNGMSFYEVAGRKISMLFANHPLLYFSTEGEEAIAEYRRTEAARRTADKKRQKMQSNQEEFEVMKRKTRNMLLGMAVTVVIATVAVIIYKNK